MIPDISHEEVTSGEIRLETLGELVKDVDTEKQKAGVRAELKRLMTHCREDLSHERSKLQLISLFTTHHHLPHSIVLLE